MEPTCHRCAAVLNPNAVFCNQCGAPQIRVPESLTSPSAPETGNQAVGTGVFALSTSVVPVNWKQGRKAAAIAAVMMTVCAIVRPLNLVLPLWMLVGGWLAVSLYRRRTSTLFVPVVTGAKLGALAGVMGFFCVSVLVAGVFAVEIFVFKRGEELRALLRAQIDQAAAANPSSAQAITQLLQSPEGVATLVISVMFAFFLLFLLLSCAGGIFGASFSRQRTR